MRARYSRWDGRQHDPLAGGLDVGALLEELEDDLLTGAGGRAALRDLQRRGLRGRVGLDELRSRLRAQRRDLERQLDGDGPLGWLRDALDDVVDTERAELAGRDDPEARFAELALDALPRDPAGRFRALGEHDFASQEAAQRYAEIAEEVRQDLLDAWFRDLSGALGSVGPDDVARITAMMGELNDMLEARERGESYDFDGFMDRYGDLFPESPRSLDELLAVLARRAQAMQHMLAQLSAEQRRQLDELARAAFDDLDLQFQLAQLQASLGRAMAGLDLDAAPPAPGGEPADEPEPGQGRGPLSALLDGYERAAEMEDLEDALGGDYEGATLEDVDEESLRRHLGEDAVRDLRELRQVENELERAGALRRNQGELELTPRGARLLGERALTRLLERVRREPSTRTVGTDPELTGQTRPWRFGDREPIAVGQTVRNAVMRRAAEARSSAGRWGVDLGSGLPPSRGGSEARRIEAAGRWGVDLVPDDLEVAETEVRPRTATALLLDLSFSMPLQGHFVPAKRMALALHALIEGKHRQDSLHLIGFSDYARRMRPADLAAAGFERVYGTNMQHAFLLARRVLADDPRPVKQVIMVTDGEPTAHLEDGQSVFNWPPIPETLERTLREAMRLARLEISLDIFLLEDAPGLVAFAERLAALTGGQVMRMSADDVGRTVVSGY